MNILDETDMGELNIPSVIIKHNPPYTEEEMQEWLIENGKDKLTGKELAYAKIQGHFELYYKYADKHTSKLIIKQGE